MSDGGGIDTASGMGLYVQGGHLVLIGSKGTAGQFNFVLNGPVIDDGQWHQFAATWTDDTTVNGVKLYMDGVLVAQGTALASIASDSNHLDFGGHTQLALPFLNGLLDELSAYNATLSPADIATLYALRGAGETSLSSTVTGNMVGTDVAGTVAWPTAAAAC